MRDGDKRYGGKGVLKAAGHISKELAAAVVGQDATNQRAIDHVMIEADGTPNKGKFGANAILAVSMATARAAAKPTACRCTGTSAARIRPPSPCHA